jgi:hypothetical protein
LSICFLLIRIQVLKDGGESQGVFFINVIASAGQRNEAIG